MIIPRAKENPRKRVRTISGVTILSVMTKPLPCPGQCVYCPGGFDKPIPTPKSYMPKSPTVLRALRKNYDSRGQIQGRIEALDLNGHIAEKNEVIVMGGTFMASPPQYRLDFVKGIYDGLNLIESKTLEEAKKINEATKHRCVGLCIETRPDWCSPDQIQEMLGFGTTRIELGVQIPDDENYELTKRGHTVQDVINSTRLLKDAGFKIYYHYMCNLPGSNPEKDAQMFKELVSNPDFRPDGFKLYPCVVIEDTELEGMMKEGKYTPYTTEQVVDILAKIKPMVPRWARIQRVMRDLPAEYIVGGTKFSHLRDAAQEKLKRLGLKCECIRCREAGYALLKGKKIEEKNIVLNRVDYTASGGKEIFLSFDDKENDVVVGLLRLRIPGQTFRKEITPTSSIVRELHVFGVEKSLQEKGVWLDTFQHRGFGKKLMAEAERITKEEFGFDKVVVISGVGVREYYRKLGYRLEGEYMVKMI